ncbi:hypothetical protein BGZ81_001084, partial [Podila clonocystis]
MQRSLDKRRKEINIICNTIISYDQIHQLETSAAPLHKGHRTATTQGAMTADILKVPDHWPLFKGPKGMTNSQEFFTRFHLEAIPAIKETAFKDNAPTYLRVCLTDENDISRFEQAVKDNKIWPYTTELLEDIFMQACQTPQELGDALEEIAHVGRHSNETYEVYARRIQRLTSRYKINDKDHYL